MGVPTHGKGHAESSGAESSGGQGEPELEGCPSGPAWASTPKSESVCFTFTNSSDIHGGYPWSLLSVRKLI